MLQTEVGMVKEPVVVVSPIQLPADSPAVAVYQEWRDAGGLVKEIVERALILYGASAEYKVRLGELRKGGE